MLIDRLTTKETPQSQPLEITPPPADVTAVKSQQPGTVTPNAFSMFRLHQSLFTEETVPDKRQQCMQKYGNRHYLSEHNKALPPLLYTFPGSGNTWSRLLIEYATGIYTGSVYNDGTLLKPLPGEFTCNWQVSVVKAHPHTHPAIEFINGHFNSDENKCKRGGIPRFERAVLLLRDPFDSIWSEFQRRVTQSHVQGIPKDTFNWPRWQANAASLSHEYLKMWETHHSAMERHWKAENVLYVKYEDLKNKQTRVATLKTIVDFLRYRHLTIDSERLECAFELAENRDAHRTIDTNMMTKHEAYIEDVVCRMWSLYGSYALAHGYKVWKGMNCSGYAAIPKVNVGPHGDYDRRWVKAGMKLLDFRGLPKEVMSNNQPGQTTGQSIGQSGQSAGHPGQSAQPPLVQSRQQQQVPVSNPRKPVHKPPPKVLPMSLSDTTGGGGGGSGGGDTFPGTFEEIAALRKKERKETSGGGGKKRVPVLTSGDGVGAVGGGNDGNGGIGGIAEKLKGKRNKVLRKAAQKALNKLNEIDGAGGGGSEPNAVE